MITAKNQVSDLVEALAYGANDYLAKPFSKDEFLARIKTHLDLYSINSATTRFVPSEFLRSLGYGTITDVRLGDYQEKDVTVFFSDIRAYTTMSETMTPEQNFKFVGAYVNRMGPVIKQFEGFVLQYLGDGIMALFLESADKAINAAIVMQTAIRRYNNSRIKLDRIPIVVGMGLHSGPLVMGIIGDKDRNDPATISDAVNVASRMEGLTTIFGAKILVTKATMKRLEKPENFDSRYLGKVLTKGKKEHIEIFEILGGESDERKNLKLQTKHDIEAGIEAYLKKNYHLAISKFSTVLDINPDDEAAKYYLQKTSAELDVMV
jgi:class 3 adenylate cyclase